MDGLDQKIYDQAVKYLSVRLHTTGELYRKLKQKGYQDALIRPVLRRLEELKFLDDQRFAEIFTDNLKHYKDFGYYGVKTKLLARQIPSDMAEAALRDFYPPADEFAVARRLVAKLKRQGRKDREKLTRSLAGKGFRSEVIYKILQ